MQRLLVLRLVIPLALGALLPLTAAERRGPATDIAVAMISERAAEVRANGNDRLAKRLEDLSDALAEGSMSLDEAVAVTQIAGSLAGLDGRGPAPGRPPGPPPPPPAA